MKQEVHWWTWNSYSANLCLGSTFLCTINVLDTPAVHTESHTCMLMKWLLLKKRKENLFMHLWQAVFTVTIRMIFFTHTREQRSANIPIEIYTAIWIPCLLCAQTMHSLWGPLFHIVQLSVHVSLYIDSVS